VLSREFILLFGTLHNRKSPKKKKTFEVSPSSAIYDVNCLKEATNRIAHALGLKGGCRGG
jgi:hypothetical protein